VIYAFISPKNFAFKCLGLILNKTTSKSTIDRQLDILFNSVHHGVISEREVVVFIKFIFFKSVVYFYNLIEIHKLELCHQLWLRCLQSFGHGSAQARNVCQERVEKVIRWHIFEYTQGRLVQVG
jgi:hypothetical protein